MIDSYDVKAGEAEGHLIGPGAIGVGCSSAGANSRPLLLNIRIRQSDYSHILEERA